MNEISDDIFGNRPWFAVRYLSYDRINQLYEESTVLVRASSDEEALQKGEKIANEVCASIEGYTYTGFAETYHLFDDKIEDGVEVYSTMRRSTLSPERYIKTYLRTGEEVGFASPFDPSEQS